MSDYKILVIEGDGIGPEIVPTAVKVLQKIGEKFGHGFNFEHALMGHCAIEATGQPLPQETLDKAKRSDAVLFGAIGHPKYDNDPSAKVRPEQGLLQIRKELGLFANIRPIRLFDQLLSSSAIKEDILKGTDILFFRELTGGVYFGERGRREDGNFAYDTMSYSKYEVERIARLAFEAAKMRRKKVTSVDKANVLESSRLWREVVTEVAKDYPDVQLEHLFVDNASMQLIIRPTSFDVVLTENMFGDILTDEASQIAGSIGMLASASIGSEVGLFEPIHGSAPDIAGQNKANPLATILSAGLLLETGLGLKAESEAVFEAVKRTLEQGYRGRDISTSSTDPDKILGTEEMGDKVLENL